VWDKTLIYQKSPILLVFIFIVKLTLSFVILPFAEPITCSDLRSPAYFHFIRLAPGDTGVWRGETNATW